MKFPQRWQTDQQRQLEVPQQPNQRAQRQKPGEKTGNHTQFWIRPETQNGAHQLLLLYKALYWFTASMLLQATTNNFPSFPDRKERQKEARMDGSKQVGEEGRSLIGVRYPSWENGRDIPHSQILVWHQETACNEVWRRCCPDGEMTWGGTRQTQTDGWKGRQYPTGIQKHGFSQF